MLVQGLDRRRVATMLPLGAMAPLIGADLMRLFHVPCQDLLIYLSVFARLLLYLGVITPTFRPRGGRHAPRRVPVDSLASATE